MVNTDSTPSSISTQTTCFHCGENCSSKEFHHEEKIFCCQGCFTVYGILHLHELDDYYCYSQKPGIRTSSSSNNKFAFLEDEEIVQKLLSFRSAKVNKVILYLPQIHCASCLWLLEHLYKLHEGFQDSQVNFVEKKVSIRYNPEKITLRRVAEILSGIGYEPHISLQDYEENSTSNTKQKDYIKLGVAGFCFANIMLISFPEYLGLNFESSPTLTGFLRYMNLVLAIPSLAVGGREFFVNAWYSLKQKTLNIDAPIALAITISFLRSVYEILSHTGAGYLDSMSGIIFFMLIGRALQHKTFTNLKFNRDFKSYFPISVLCVKDGKEVSTRIQEVKKEDVIRLHHQEIIPVDAILLSKACDVDYSFVTGENEPSRVQTGSLLYAGGKILNGLSDVMVVKPFSQNSFTALWNNDAFLKHEKPEEGSFIVRISNYFTLVLFTIALGGFAYWYGQDTHKSWNALTGVLIVACPCTLLLASSYTYGFLIQHFSSHGFFVKNVQVLHALRQIKHVVFDKTGTISDIQSHIVKHEGEANENSLQILFAVMNQSTHPLSKSILASYQPHDLPTVEDWKEHSGQGIVAWYEDKHIKIGRAAFVNGVEEKKNPSHAIVYYSIDDQTKGSFLVMGKVKKGIPELLKALRKKSLSVLSGDNNNSEKSLKEIFPVGSELLFEQSPQQKLDYIKRLQNERHESVLMIGDGLNDAGALKQSDVGISVVSDHFSFSPASDIILHQQQIGKLHRFMQANEKAKKLIVIIFIYSLLYNAVGISIAVSASLQPFIAAILMPVSSISVMLFAYLGTRYWCRVD